MTLAARRCVLVAAVLSLALLVLPSGRADADSPDRSGWWWKANAGLPVAPPRPAVVPEGGLWVARDATGEQAVSALRIDGGLRRTATVLRLQADPPTTTAPAALSACAVTASWEPADGGPWTDVPTWDCNVGRADGSASSDGLWQFAVDSLSRSGVVDVAIVPTPGSTDVFSVAFRPPNAETFTVAPTSTTTTTTSETEEEGAGTETTNETFETALPASEPTTTFDSPFPALAPVVSPGGIALGSTEPVASTGTGEQVGIGVSRPFPTRAPVGGGSTGAGGLLAGLALAGAGAWVAWPVRRRWPLVVQRAGLGRWAGTPAARLLSHPRVRPIVPFVASAAVLLLVQRILWPAPLGVLITGTVLGGLTALIAFGIALIYRANHVVNFAQGDLGGVPGALGVLLIVGPAWPYPLAMLTALVLAPLLGAAVEFLVIRRFFRAPRLILTVATLGLAQLLAGIEVVLPSAFDLTVPPQSFPSPFDFRFELGGVFFSGNDVIAMIAVPVVIAALAAFLRFTNVGVAIRASAESADRASLLGVPVKRLHTLVWAIATLLATIAMLLRAGVVGLPLGTVLGPGMLVRALVAVVIGRMERLSVILAAAIGVGVVEQAIVYNTSRGIFVDLVLFVGVVVALLAQRHRAPSRAAEAATSTWRAAQEVRPVPEELQQVPEVRWGSLALRWVVRLALVALPFVFGESRTNLASGVLILAIVGLSLVVLTGWAGQVSLGQVAFVGVGAAVAGALSTNWGWDVSACLLAAGVVGAVTAMVIGLPALRIRGLFLAVTTLAFALATSSYLLNPSVMGWLPKGRVPRTPLFDRVDIAGEARYYFLCLAGFGFALWAVRGLRASRTGRVLIAVRENESGARAFGINPMRAKLTAFAASGFLAAFAGGLFVFHQQGLGTTSFLPEQSLRAFTMVVIGGLGSIPGAVLGAVYVQSPQWFQEYLPRTLRPLLFFFTSGVGLLFVLMMLPGGLGGALYGIRDRLLRQVAERRGILVPSLLADARDERLDASAFAGTDASLEATVRERMLAPAAPTSTEGRS